MSGKAFFVGTSPGAAVEGDVTAARTQIGGAALLAGLLFATSAGCTGSTPTSVTIAVDHPTALADTPLHVQIAGLGGGQRVTVQASAATRTQGQWLGYATFRSDAHGA